MIERRSPQCRGTPGPCEPASPVPQMFGGSTARYSALCGPRFVPASARVLRGRPIRASASARFAASASRLAAARAARRRVGTVREIHMYEIVAPPLLALVFAIVVTAIAAYWAYRSWFDSVNLRQELLSRQQQLPTWYPLRGYFVRWFQHCRAIRDLRIINTIGFLITAAFTIFLIVAAFVGSMR